MDFQTAQESISTALVDTTRIATRISSEDIGFHRSLDPAAASLLDRQNARLLSLAETLLSNAASTLDVESPSLPDAEAVENNWKSVVDVVDGLLERVDTCLDEFTGLVKRLSPSTQSQAPSPKPQSRRPGPTYRNRNIPKPQRLFEHPPSNDEVGPFKPLLTSKPHSLVPLQVSKPDLPNDKYQHPYETEINQYKYPKSVLTKTDPISYSPFNESKATFVDTLEDVDAMIDELKEATEVAIDLEHHDTHSYIGIVSLMQISTRNSDWIVDTLKPWRRKLECLNEIFANPNILKVLHGAHMDVIWLQRDLGLYLVGLFDTHHASRVLGYAGGSLAFLLKKFVNFDAQKQYQLADWRLRPLPPELVDYARSDTHFLLYIYDNMRNELIEKSNFQIPGGDLVEAVLAKSKETSLQRYENPIYDLDGGTGPSGWFRLLEKTPMLLTKEQFAAFRSVHQWRDKVARQEDESTHTIMPSHVIFNVIREMPETVPKLLTTINPISSQVRIRATELLGVIRKAQAEAQTNPKIMSILTDTNESLGLLKATSRPSVVAHRSLITTADAANNVTGTTSFRLPVSRFWGGLSGRAAISHTCHNELNFQDAFLVKSIPSLAVQPGDSINLDPEFSASSLDEKAMEAEQNLSTPHFQLSRKRPADAITADAGAEEMLSSPPDRDDFEALNERLTQRAARKAARKVRKERANGTSVQRPVVPFDYATAPSVLNGSKANSMENPAFNPFAKSLNAPSGMARSQSFTVGKSATFKK